MGLLEELRHEPVKAVQFFRSNTRCCWSTLSELREMLRFCSPLRDLVSCAWEILDLEIYVDKF